MLETGVFAVIGILILAATILTPYPEYSRLALGAALVVTVVAILWGP